MEGSCCDRLVTEASDTGQLLDTEGSAEVATGFFLGLPTFHFLGGPGLVGLLNNMGKGAVVGMQKLRRDSCLDIFLKKW